MVDCECLRDGFACGGLAVGDDVCGVLVEEVCSVVLVGWDYLLKRLLISEKKDLNFWSRSSSDWALRC